MEQQGSGLSNIEVNLESFYNSKLLVMKDQTIFMILAALSSCGQRSIEREFTEISYVDSTADILVQEMVDDKENSQLHGNPDANLLGPENATLYKLTNTIITDFNGDGFLDKALYQREIETFGIIIIQGKTKEVVRLGFGKPFAHLNDFNWVD